MKLYKLRVGEFYLTSAYVLNGSSDNAGLFNSVEVFNLKMVIPELVDCEVIPA